MRDGDPPDGASAPRDAVRMVEISKSFGGVQALAHVDFSVRYGEVHALLGENGAGKSTLLKILRGVLQADSGRIEIGGEALPAPSADAIRRAGVAMIFQEMSLIPTLSVAQNIFSQSRAERPPGPGGRRADHSRHAKAVR